ncbi:MAG: prepilin-type N-terminal cleavage/methylation domain-containing protein [Candidatus Pacebacteria bacterium]|nr:prepilin-type N-terminal cleavage/methylation domain-containing protein [Candidatus Paceibacterota bacterium]
MRTSTSNQHHQNGFTLIELLVYISISTIFLGGAILFAWNIIYARVQSEVQQQVLANSLYANKKITDAIQNAVQITTITPNLIELEYTDTNKNGMTIEYDGAQLWYFESNQGTCKPNNPCALTPADLVVTAFAFSDRSLAPDTQSVSFNMTIESQSTRKEWNYAHSTQSTATIRGYTGL